MSDLVTISEVIVAAVKVQTAALRTRCEELETRIATLEAQPADDLDPDAISAAVADLLRKELGDLTVPVTRKRTVRDATGAVKYEIEEA